MRWYLLELVLPEPDVVTTTLPCCAHFPTSAAIQSVDLARILRRAGDGSAIWRWRQSYSSVEGCAVKVISMLDI